MNVHDCADALRRHGWVVNVTEIHDEYCIQASHAGGRFDVELVPTYESCLYDNGIDALVLHGECGARKVFKRALKASQG